MAYPDAVVRAVARGEPISASQVTASVVESAIEHRMAALLLKGVGEDSGISTGEVAALVAFDMAVAARRRQQDAVVSSVHRRLDDAGIPHTFVKGYVSAHRWFDAPTDRPYSDIDVVIPPGAAFARAVSIFEPLHPALPLLERLGQRSQLSSIDVTVDDVHVDLQTDALRTGLTPRDGDGWTIGTDRLGENGLAILDPEHDFVMFLLHQGRDRFRFLLGVAELHRRLLDPPDWRRVEVIARQEGVWEQVAVALEVMCADLDMASPIETPSGWRVYLWRRLWREEVRLLGEIGRVRHVVRGRWLMPLTIEGRAREASLRILGSIFPPDEILRFRYPAARGPYFWRVLANRLRVFSRRRMWVWRTGK